MRRRNVGLLGVGSLVGIGLVIDLATSGRGPGDIPAGTGYAALDLCSRAMLSGEEFNFVRTRFVEPKVRPLPHFWKVDYEPGVRVSVSTSLPLLASPRTAIYRAGLGCTLVPPGTSEATVRGQPFVPVKEPPRDPRPWPLGEGSAESELLDGNTRAVVDRRAEPLFAESSRDPKDQQKTTALLLAHNGRMVYERYGEGFSREQPQLGWSMTKTLTAIVAGAMARDGKITLDAPVGLARWKGTPKQSITWRNLLNMAPGLAWDEGYGGASDATEMLFSQADEGTWAADRPLSSEPGTTFTYSTGFTNIAMLAMKGLLGGSHQAIYDYTQSQVFAPLGIHGAVIEPDASGTPVGGARGFLRPVDWLRLGQLVENGGIWNGAVIVPPDYLAFMESASPASAEYGGFMWRRESRTIQPAVRDRLPADLVWFAGHLGQFVVVVPSRKWVVLRMGVSFGGERKKDATRDRFFAFVADLLAATGP
jgi:CubicO group peptidase (beta-lactamase class C family)